MKKVKMLVSLVLCVAMVFAFAVTAYAATNATYTPRYVTGNQVNFRAGPSSTSTVLGTLNYGEQFNEVMPRSGWSYGWPAPGTGVYEYYGEAVYGYVNSYYLT